MKAVFDTNVLVAAFATEGLCSKLLHRANRKTFGLFLSPFISREFAKILEKKLALSPGEIEEANGLLAEVAVLIDPEEKSITVLGVCRDEDDNQILACALSCEADYIVTGDQDLLALKTFRKIRIVSPREFELLFA